MSHSASLAQAPDPPPVVEGDDRGWMLDRVIVHKIVVGLNAAHPAVSDLLDQLARIGGRLRTLDVRPLGSAFEVVLRAEGLAPEGARRLVDGYHRLPEVASARVEHMLVR